MKLIMKLISVSIHLAAGGCDIRMISDGPHLIAYADYVSTQIFLSLQSVRTDGLPLQNIVNRMLLAFVTRRASVC